MSIKSLLIRFTAIYVALLIAISIVVVVLKAKSNSGANTGALIGAAFAACNWFAAANKRYFSSEEKKTVIIGMCLINLFLQIFAALIIGKASGLQIPFSTIFLGILMVGLLHSAGIYFIVGMVGKQFAKQN